MRRESPPADRARDARDWLGQVAGALVPPPMDGARARAFRLGVLTRIERRDRRGGVRMLGAGALAATAGLALGFAIGGAPSGGTEADRLAGAPPIGASAPLAAQEPVRVTWFELDEEEQASLPAESLPADYLALASFVAAESP